ncbi:MAG: AI-2E family transporter [Lautropia sp.]|nr:AI-2E family transporter [Lautropia sp.]
MPTFISKRPLQPLVFSLLLIILIGWLLKIGQSVLIPILTALIAVYVLVRTAEGLGRVPLIGKLPEWARRVLVLIGFVVLAIVLGSIVVSTGEQVIAAVPRYQDNLEGLLVRAANWLDLDQLPNWQTIQSMTIEQIDVQGLLTGTLGSLGSGFGVVALVGVYMVFLLSERNSFSRKLSVAMPGESASQTQALIRDINQQIGNYLAFKTLINVLLGCMTWIVMHAIGVDFALFWALILALLNYIPYVGAFIGISFPVLLTLAQFGSLQTTLLVGILLSAAQFYVGSVLEPRVIGRQVNLSPFVVLVALSLWYSLWGVAGAILAIPLTSMLTIIMAAFPGTRPLAILLAEDVETFVDEAATD